MSTITSETAEDLLRGVEKELARLQSAISHIQGSENAATAAIMAAKQVVQSQAVYAEQLAGYAVALSNLPGKPETAVSTGKELDQLQMTLKELVNQQQEAKTDVVTGLKQLRELGQKTHDYITLPKPGPNREATWKKLEEVLRKSVQEEVQQWQGAAIRSLDQSQAIESLKQIQQIQQALSGKLDAHGNQWKQIEEKRGNAQAELEKTISAVNQNSLTILQKQADLKKDIQQHGSQQLERISPAMKDLMEAQQAKADTKLRGMEAQIKQLLESHLRATQDQSNQFVQALIEANGKWANSVFGEEITALQRQLAKAERTNKWCVALVVVTIAAVVSLKIGRFLF